MRRLPILLALGLVFALFVVAAATAAPPDVCIEGTAHYNPNHPICATPPTPTTTTTEPPVVQPCASITTLDGVTNLFCDWTPEPGSSVGTVTVTVEGGEIGGLVIWVLDSLPGNICVLEQINKPTETESVSFSLAEEGETYWDNATGWCAQYDEFGTKDDLNGEPLYVRVRFRAKKDTAVTISLTPDQVASE